MASYRLEARAGSLISLTTVMSRIVQEHSIHIIEFDFVRSTEDTLTLLAKSQAAEQFLKAVIEKGFASRANRALGRLG